MIEIRVAGTPAPQGSKRFVGHAKSGRGIMIESSAKVKPWREAVKWAAMELHLAAPMQGPLAVEMIFGLARPKSAPKKRIYPDRKPDLSKLVRSTEDALTDAGIWGDDAQVVRCEAAKTFAGAGMPLVFPGAIIRVRRIE